MYEQIVILILLITIFGVLQLLKKQQESEMETLKFSEEILEELLLTTKRENYLLKTMNDAMKVTAPKQFMAHRMEIAPKDFKPKSEEEINPDKITS